MTASVTTFCDECGASNPLQATHCFACNAALQPPTPAATLAKQIAPTQAVILTNNGALVPSSLLHGRYSIVSQIGTGGFGAVYKAKDTLFSHRLVAIKEMSQDGLSLKELAEATAAFEHEALLLADLTHPNLPRIHDHFTENSRSYVVMDFITGNSLEDYMDKFVQRFSVQAALEIGIQLCTVLDYLHSHQPPIIFRDVKPANIMCTIDNHIYLIDFGIARHFKPGKARDTVPLGSKGYAAPEQYGKAQTTPQTDIYGLGATLHQLLTGDDPSLTPFQFAPLRLPRTTISGELDALLKSMLEMEMSKRPASMAVVKQELQRLLALQTPQQQSLVQSKAQAITGRRNFMKGCLSVIATIGISTTITTFIVERPNLVDTVLAHPFTANSQVPSPSSPLPVQATILNKPLYTYYGNSGSVTAVAWSPDGQYISSVGTLDSAVQLWDATTGNLLLIPTVVIDPPLIRTPILKILPALFSTNNQIVDGLAWSPDSSHLAVAQANGSVDIWRIATGDDFLFGFSESGDVNAVAWSPDGKSIAAISGNTYVEVRSATTGKLSFTFTGHNQYVLAIAWSPDGKRIASAGSDGIVQIWDIVLGDSVVTTANSNVTYRGHTAEVNTIAWSPDSNQIASGGVDGNVLVWDAATGRTLFTYTGHTGAINAVTWQPVLSGLSVHNLCIASCGNDATVQVWSLGRSENRREMIIDGKILVYRGHSGPVTSVTWSPDGQFLASGSEDGTVQIWRAM
jgi:WD40 repeat protein